MRRVPRRGARARGFSCGEIPWSFGFLVEQGFNPDARAAFLQPAVGLFIDGPLHQSFLDKVPRIFEGRRSLVARFRPRHYPRTVKFFDGLLVNPDAWPDAAVLVTAK